MATLRSLRHVFVAVFAFALLAMGATDAHATHFRYGTIRWESIPTNPVDPNAIRIKVTAESAWRRSFPWPSGQVPTNGVPLNTGYTVVVQSLASGLVSQAPLSVTPSSINVGEDWFVGSSQLEFQFAKALLPVRVYFENSARISNLRDGNNDRPFRVESIVSATPNAASPASSILPIITVGVGPAATFFIPAADVEGDTLTWSIAPLNRSQLIKAAPDGADDVPPATLTINSATGLVTWATDQELPPVADGDFYAVQFIVADSKGGETPVDALLRLIPGSGTAPEVLINGSSNSHSVSVRPNNPVTFTVTGTDVDSSSSVTLNSGALPPGSSMTPSLPTTSSSPVTSVFNWTPTLAQAGNNFVVSFSATDNLGLQDTNSATITVLNNFPPAVGCIANVSVEATGPTGATATLSTSVSDPDGDALTVQWFVDNVLVQTDNVPASGGSTPVSLIHLYAIGNHTVRVEVNDGLVTTTSCATMVTVVDGPPVLTLPPPQTLEATSFGGAVATFTATATDAVDGPLTVTCVPPSGSTFPLGINTVTCSATDSANHTVTGTFTITVRDTTPPVIANVPAPITREATSPAGAAATWPSPTATDIADPSVPVTCAPVSGSTFAINPPGPVTLVTCTATDDSGNSSTATFTVTVVDTTPPTIHNMPANITVSPTGPTGAIVTWPPPNATDLVDVTDPVTCVPPSGSLFPLGNTTVTCTSTDAHGNSASATFIVRVADSTPPIVIVTLNPGELWPPDHKMIPIAVTVSTSDNDPNPSCAITSVTSNQPTNGTGDGDTDVDWAYSGLRLSLRRERAGNAGKNSVRIYTVTVSCTDSSGNVGTGTATARVVHDQGNSGTTLLGLNLLN